MNKYKVAVVGATGMVGRKFLEVLKERDFPAEEYLLFASKRSAGKVIEFLGKDYTVIELCEENIKKHVCDIALFSAGGSVSKVFAPVFADTGAVVIDNSSQWRMDENVPLVVPEVNPEDIDRHSGIIANPNCSTIQAVVALKPLAKYDIKRIVYSTYQAVSGAGMSGYDDLANGLKGEAPKSFPTDIAGNCIPHIDVFMDNGYTKEEIKMINETKKILNDYELKITATTVRVPVFHGHSESINVEFNNSFDLDELRETLKRAPGVVVMDDVKNLVYPTPLFAEDKDEVFVGRIRRDDSVENGVNLWVVSDNIRKGAATNAIQIAEELIRRENRL